MLALSIGIVSALDRVPGNGFSIVPMPYEAKAMEGKPFVITQETVLVAQAVEAKNCAAYLQQRLRQSCGLILKRKGTTSGKAIVLTVSDDATAFSENDAYVLPTQGEAGGLASSKEAYYSFDYGDIHFVCLDSFRHPRGTDEPMALWLKEDLKATKAKWLIAFWHHPPYSNGSHDSNKDKRMTDMRKDFMPILEAAGVDLVLAGYSHSYERTMLIDGAYHTPTHNHGVVLDDGDGDWQGHGAYHKSEGLTPRNGTVAIVAGHGAKLGRTRAILPIMRTVMLKLGSVILDVKGNTLSCFMLDAEGNQLDPFQIVKEGTVKPKALENPGHRPMRT